MSASPRQWRRAYALSLALFVAAILCVAAYSLWRLRSDAITGGLAVSALHSHSFETVLTQSLQVADQTANNLAPNGNEAANLRKIQAAFVLSLRNTPFLRSISLQDATGRILASSNPANTGLVIDTHTYLPQDSESQDFLRIGQPWSGRDFVDGFATTPQSPAATDAQSFVPLVRTLHTGGRPMALLLAVNSDYFITNMLDALGSQVGWMEILRYDGVLLMSSAPESNAGSSQAPFVKSLELTTNESGSFEQQDAQRRSNLASFRASALYPVVIVTHLDRDDALKEWRTEAKTLIAALAPTLLVILLLVAAFYRRQMEAALQRDEAERLLRINATVFEASSEAIMVTDANANILSVNAAFTAITGYTEQEVQGRNPRLLASGQHDKTFYANVWTALIQTGKWHGELVNQRKDGTLFDAQITITRSLNSNGQVQHYVGVMVDVTERKKSELQVFELNRDFVSFLENTSDFIYFKDKDSRFRFASQPLAAITGHRSWRELIGKHDLEVFPADMAQIYIDEEVPIFRDGTALLNKVNPYFDAGGNGGWISTNKWPLLGNNGHVTGLFGISRDITVQKQNEAQLELAASVFANSREGIMITETDGTIIDVNEAFSRITGYARNEVIGQNPRILKSGQQSAAHYMTMWQELIKSGHWCGEVWNRRKNGEIFAEMQTISTVLDAQGKPRHYVALFSDITSSKVHEAQLNRIAHYDTLTDLPNRVLLADRLSQSMAQAHRRGTQLAVVFLDLDGFKTVNDSHGHEAGDHLLMTLAKKMKNALREGDTLARIGGDEFVAVMVDLANSGESLPILKRLLDAASEPLLFHGVRLQVSASLGVTFYPQDDEIDADQLQRQADQSMYQAKLAGKNRFHFFDAEHDRNVRVQHASLENIRHAIGANELVLHYQPKVNMRTGQVIGAEALIRWQHPERGLLAPAQFLPVIENHILAVDVGEWVMHQALTQMQTWHLAGLDLSVSVNVGARQLQQLDFVLRLQNILATHPGIRPGYLELEVLETSALEDIGGVSKVIAACNALGVSFALDDFGTGYSSLNYLKRLPVSMLKIDQSFVRDMFDEPDNLAILQGVIGLAKAFQRGVIAEGVETIAHGTALLRMGCELAQGYGIARPMPADEFVLWVDKWRKHPAWPAQVEVVNH